jgi:hypothetical protein
MKTIDLSDYRWEKHGASYDEDDRLQTHVGPADVTVEFSAERIGLKIRKNGGEHSYCYPLDKVPIDIFGDCDRNNRLLRASVRSNRFLRSRQRCRLQVEFEKTLKRL